MNREIKKNTLLFSVGPHQVITQFILAKQKKLDDRIIGVLRTRAMTDGETINEDLEKCEAYIHSKLGVNQIAHLDSVYKLWGKSKIEKMLSLPFLKKKIRKMLIDVNLDVDKVENIILTARYDLGEVLLLSAFKNLKKVYFVSDGNPDLYTKKKAFALPFYLAFYRYRNPYKVETDIYFYNENIPDNYKRISPKLLDSSIVDSVYNLFLNDPFLQEWLSKLREESVVRSVLFLPPFGTYPDLQTIIEIYKKIIRTELNITNNTIIIKHHPRENKEFLERFRISLMADFGNKVRFYDNSYLSRLPIEIYYKTLNVNRVITLSSTSALFTNNAEIVFYSSVLLRKRIIYRTEYHANRLNKKVNYV